MRRFIGVSTFPLPVELPDLATFARRPREALMWVPRAIDVARIRAALDAAGPRAVDVGAGTGLLAKLLGTDVDAVDPTPPRVTYHPVRLPRAGHVALPGTRDMALPGTRDLAPYDAAVVSWMEAGQDYRAEVARLAPVIVNAYDVEGGCGVLGAVDFAPFGFVEAASWRAPSFEDAAYALDHRGALKRPGYPACRIDVLARDPAMGARLREAVGRARAGAPLPWEREMDALGL